MAGRDWNLDGTVDAADVDYLCARVNSHDAAFDLNADGMVDDLDVNFYVTEQLRTAPGDANLDGVFNSTDLVMIFRFGEYEDSLEDNSGWAEGDWNCDQDFNSSDLVAAFTGGGYVAEAQFRGVDLSDIGMALLSLDKQTHLRRAN